MRAPRLVAWSALVVMGLLGAWPGSPAGATGTRRPAVARVLVVSVPRLAWDDLASGAMPNLRGLTDRGAVASLSVRSVGRHTSRAEGYATLGAGARAAAPEDPGAVAVDAGAGVRLISLDRVGAANRSARTGARVGALGDALRGAGRPVAVVGNHDGPDGRDRAVALGATDHQGLVRAGTVGPALTMSARGAAPARTDVAVLQQELTAAASARVTLVELGDVDFADGRPAAQRDAAVRRTDRVIAALLAGVDLRTDLVLVVAPVSSGSRDQPTPFVIAGPGIGRGWARSATTRTDGYVTLPDVAPTILDRLGIAVPSAMDGTPIEVTATPRTADRIGHLAAETAEVRFVDLAAGHLFSTIPIVFSAWALLGLLAALLRPSPVERLLRPFVRWVGLAQLAMPGVAFALGAVTVRHWGQPAWAAVLWGGAGLIALAASQLRAPARAPLAIAAATWLLFVVDLATGGHLQFLTALGNSPTVAGRFAGIGNLGFAVLAATTVLLAVAVHRVALDRDVGERTALIAAGAVCAVAVVLDGAPGAGADIGGVLALVPTSAVALAVLAPRRPSWLRLAAAAVGVAVAVLGGFALLDATRPEGEQSHLARFTDRLGGGGDDAILVRKAHAAFATLTHSSLVWVPITAAIALALLWRFARPALAEQWRNRWGRAAWCGTGALCLLGAVLNDSGVMVPALVLVVFAPTVAHVALRRGGPLDRGVA